jgi:hypothetical protein
MSGTTQPGRRIELYSWDSRSRAWSGPDEIAYSLKGSRRILDRLREGNGSWRGELRPQSAGLPALPLWAHIRDLGDVCLGTLDLEGNRGGLIEAVLVIPPERRPQLRAELAFEFTAFLRFLEGPVSHGSELAFHDGLERLLKEAASGATIVISVETRFTEPDEHLLIALACERLSMSMVAWVAEKRAAESRP